MYISGEAAMDLELNTPHPLNQCIYPQRASLAFHLVNLPRPVLNRILFLTTNTWGGGGGGGGASVHAPLIHRR